MKTAIVSTILLSILLTGCFKYTVKVGQGGNLASAPAKSVWNHHFIDGLAGEGEIDVSAVCPSNDATVKIERTVIDAILTNATGVFLWQPSTIEIYCGGSIAELELGEEQQRAFAKSPLFEEAVGALAPERLSEAQAIASRL